MSDIGVPDCDRGHRFEASTSQSVIGVLDLGPPEVSKISGVKFAIGVLDLRPKWQNS